MDRKTDPLAYAFEPLIGLPAWFVRKGQGSFLTLEFGMPHLEIRDPIEASPEAPERVRTRLRRRHVMPSGEWHLWIYRCHWRMLAEEQEIASSEASDQEIHLAVAELDGQRLTSVVVDPTNGTSTFRFDLGASIHTWPYDQDRSDQWMLYMKSGDVFTYRSDGFYTRGPADQSPEDSVWQPLPPSTVV